MSRGGAAESIPVNFRQTLLGIHICLNTAFPRGPQHTHLGLHNLGRQEDQELLLRHRFRLVLEQPSEDRDSRQIRHSLHVVVLRIDEDTADDHGFAVADDDLGVRFPAIDARTSRIASRTHGVAGGASASTLSHS